jgi:hypothetical protein
MLLTGMGEGGDEGKKKEKSKKSQVKSKKRKRRFGSSRVRGGDWAKGRLGDGARWLLERVPMLRSYMRSKDDARFTFNISRSKFQELITITTLQRIILFHSIFHFIRNNRDGEEK